MTQRSPRAPTVAAAAPADRGLTHRVRPRLKGRRSAWLVVAVCGVLGLAALVRWLAATPAIDSTWRLEGAGVLELGSSPRPELQPMINQRLRAVRGADGSVIAATGLAVRTPPRWTLDDDDRRRMVQAREQLAGMLRQGPVHLEFEDGRSVEVHGQPRGLAGIGAVLWLLAAVALVQLGVGAWVVIRHPGRRTRLYAALLLAQAVTLLVIGIESMPGLGAPPSFTGRALWLRSALDLIVAAIVVHLATLAPLRVPHAAAIRAACWAALAALFAALIGGRLPHAWWWLQAAALAAGALTIVLCRRSYRLEPNPLALLTQRLTAVALGPLALLTMAMALAGGAHAETQDLTVIGPVIWTLFLSLLLLAVPFAAPSRLVLRELAIFAGAGSVAVSLDLLLAAALGLDRLTSLTLALFIALGLYAASRDRLIGAATGGETLGAGRLFERLYRGVREVEAAPERRVELMTALLHDLFEPMHVHPMAQDLPRARVGESGATLLVPLPLADGAPATEGSVLLRFAGRGRRLFTVDDARLADQLVEQIQRALANDSAVERGRSEERTRIAQDLHDDIGARLLTLMYKAQDPEMEDYVRHTLKDLKTLTRGLAASEHRLSFAAAEWKADIAQRLTAAQIDLDWTLSIDRDQPLSVVQWSALTRVLRELVSNVIQHSAATHVDIEVSLDAGRLRLTLADDGVGRDPQRWSQGLGLGGVRKRVRQLGGDMHWAENGRAGIVCTVLIPDLRSAGR